MLKIEGINVLMLTFIYLGSFASCEEYCPFEKFTAECKSDEIIMMDYAFYGRMNVGRCVEVDLGFIGCKADVINIMDKRCSGKTKCELTLPNKELDETEPCMKELKLYLNASYRCIKYDEIESSDCLSCKTKKSSLSNSGVISSKTFFKKRCFNNNCSIVIDEDIGKTFRLEIIDFTHHLYDADSIKCKKSIEIYEPLLGRKTNVSVKYQSNKRIKSMITTASNVVEISLKGCDAEAADTVNFIIIYEVEGCETPTNLPGGWITRNGQQITFGCNNNFRNTTAYCIDNKWSETITNCSSEVEQQYLMQHWQYREFSSGFSIFLIFIVSAAVAIVIFGIGLIILHRHFYKKKQQSEHYLNHDELQANPTKSPNYEFSWMHDEKLCPAEYQLDFQKYLQKKKETPINKAQLFQTTDNYIKKSNINNENERKNNYFGGIYTSPLLHENRKRKYENSNSHSNQANHYYSENPEDRLHEYAEINVHSSLQNTDT